MARLPRGLIRGIVIGGAVAVGWGLLANRRARTALGERLLCAAESVPFLGSRVEAAVSGPMMVSVYRAVAEDVVSEVKSGELLELGAGPGYLAAELGERARDLQVTAMDASPHLVQMTEYRVHSAGVGRQVKVALGEARDIPYPEESFDHVLSVGELSGWEWPETVLAEIHRVLKPGGKAWLYDWRRDLPEEGWELVREKVPLLQRPVFDATIMASWSRAYTEGQIREMVSRSPFGQAAVDVVTMEIAGLKVPGLTKATLQK